MNFEILSKEEDGSIRFQGTANATQASFLMEVGVNYLLQQGYEVLLTKDDSAPPTEGTETLQ